MIEKKTKGAFYHKLKHTKDEEKTTIFLGGGSVRECIPLITSNLGLKLMAMDNYRERIAIVPIAIGISLFATQRYPKRYPGLPVGLGLT